MVSIFLWDPSLASHLAIALSKSGSSWYTFLKGSAKEKDSNKALDKKTASAEALTTTEGRLAWVRYERVTNFQLFLESA